MRFYCQLAEKQPNPTAYATPLPGGEQVKKGRQQLRINPRPAVCHPDHQHARRSILVRMHIHLSSRWRVFDRIPHQVLQNTPHQFIIAESKGQVTSDRGGKLHIPFFCQRQLQPQDVIHHHTDIQRLGLNRHLASLQTADIQDFVDQSKHIFGRMACNH